MEMQIVEAPLEKGVTKSVVRKALREKFPGYRIAAIVADTELGIWRARLIEEKLAEFPLKALGPEADSDGGDDEGGDDEEPKAKKPKDDDGDEDDEGGEEDGEGGLPHGGSPDPIGHAIHILEQLQKALPEIEKLLSGLKGHGVPTDGGAGHPMGGPPPGPPGGPPGAGGPPPGGGGFPRRPGRPPLPGGGGMAGRTPPMRPGQLPTFTKVQEPQLVEREANVSERRARLELTQQFPEHNIQEFSERDGKYFVRLTPKS